MEAARSSRASHRCRRSPASIRTARDGAARPPRTSRPTGSSWRCRDREEGEPLRPAEVTASVAISELGVPRRRLVRRGHHSAARPGRVVAGVDRAALRRAGHGALGRSSGCPDRAASEPRRRPRRCCRSATTASTIAMSPASMPRRCPLARPRSRRSPGRRFRLVLSGGSAAEALPPSSPGVRLPPVLRRAHEFLVSEFALRTDARVHHAEVKAGFGVVPDYYAVDSDHGCRRGRPARCDRRHRRTSRTAMLRWDAPPGRWLILRLGASLTGQTNGPAPRDSTGLEVDKLDGARVAAYLDDAPRPLRRDGCGTRPLRGTAQRQHRGRPAELDGQHPGAVPRRAAATTRSPGSRRWPGDSWAAPTSPIGSSTTTGARIAELLAEEYYGTLGGGGPPPGHDVLRRGPRGRAPAARRRPRDARARRRADGRDVDVLARRTVRGRPMSPT